MEKYIIVKREKYNEYLIDEAISEYDIIYSKHNEYKFGKQVIIPSEPDSVYVAVECKYNEDFDLFVLYIMSLDVFMREYTHIPSEEYFKPDRFLITYSPGKDLPDITQIT